MSATMAYYHHIIESHNRRVMQPKAWDRRLKTYREWLYSRSKRAQ